ncbi:MAG: hypothetical protein AMXMBFR64_01970 [Myxococcales bacterium]
MSHRAIGPLILIALVGLPASAIGGTGAPCGDLDYQGRCKDGLVQWCEDDELHETDCSQLGRACGWDEARGFFQCVPPPGPEGTCPDDLDWSGRCEEDDRVVWCQDGAVQALECAAGSRCGWNPEGFYDCVANDGQGSYGGDQAAGAAPSEEPSDPAKPAPKGPGPATDKTPTEKDDLDLTADTTPDSAPEQTITQPGYGCSSTAAPTGALGVLVLALAARRRRPT